jgi:hypothetical protein
MGITLRSPDGQEWVLGVDNEGLLTTVEGTGGAPSSGNSTITLQSVVDYARTFTKLVPIVGVGGFSNEPALTICNDVIQDILSFPYNWKWNRSSAPSFNTVDKQQDYSAAISDFGWLENATIEFTASTDTPKPRADIEVVRNLPRMSTIGDPLKLCMAEDDGTTVVWRVSPVPGSAIWTVYPIYQRRAPIKTALTDTWAPIPDELAFVYRQGFLAHAYKHLGEMQVAQFEYQKFERQIRKALGLKDAEQTNEGFYPEVPIMLG